MRRMCGALLGIRFKSSRKTSAPPKVGTQRWVGPEEIKKGKRAIQSNTEISSETITAYKGCEGDPNIGEIKERSLEGHPIPQRVEDGGGGKRNDTRLGNIKFWVKGTA